MIGVVAVRRSGPKTCLFCRLLVGGERAQGLRHHMLTWVRKIHPAALRTPNVKPVTK